MGKKKHFIFLGLLVLLTSCSLKEPVLENYYSFNSLNPTNSINTFIEFKKAKSEFIKKDNSYRFKDHVMISKGTYKFKGKYVVLNIEERTLIDPNGNQTSQSGCNEQIKLVYINQNYLVSTEEIHEIKTDNEIFKIAPVFTYKARLSSSLIRIPMAENNKPIVSKASCEKQLFLWR